MARSDAKGDKVFEKTPETTAAKPRKVTPRANAEARVSRAAKGGRNEKRETPAPKSALARTHVSQEETPRWARDPATLAARAHARESTMEERPRPPQDRGQPQARAQERVPHPPELHG